MKNWLPPRLTRAGVGVGHSPVRQHVRRRQGNVRQNVRYSVLWALYFDHLANRAFLSANACKTFPFLSSHGLFCQMIQGCCVWSTLVVEWDMCLYLSRYDLQTRMYLSLSRAKEHANVSLGAWLKWEHETPWNNRKAIAKCLKNETQVRKAFLHPLPPSPETNYPQTRELLSMYLYVVYNMKWCVHTQLVRWNDIQALGAHPSTQIERTMDRDERKRAEGRKQGCGGRTGMTRGCMPPIPRGVHFHAPSTPLWWLGRYLLSPSQAVWRYIDTYRHATFYEALGLFPTRPFLTSHLTFDKWRQ